MSTPNPEEIRRIAEERMRGWAEKIIEAGATPCFAVAVGHGARSGEITVCIADADDVVDQQIADIATAVASQLQGKHGRGRPGKRRR